MANFFEQQHHARRQTRTLIILFILAVIAIVIAVNIAMTLIWSWTQGGYSSNPDFYPRGFFATNTLVTISLIAVGTLIEIWNLREGGDAVARMVGARLISPASGDLHEKRLLNVVEEMAIASGIACPRTYAMDKEDAINAFAAGYNQNEAVVAVSRGALSRLTRDELQGVVAHEFSHILNGDMRLNIRLIGVLFGIQMIAGFGQHLMDFGTRVWSTRERDRDERGPSGRFIMLVIGFALFVIGYIGIFFGRLIKAAVSRQREFLADASAVQFTRNADGIGGALRKISGLSGTMNLGSRIQHPNAEQLSHLFLGAPKASLVRGLFATHPPIAERLRRIYGRNVEPLDAPEISGDYGEAAGMLPDIPYVASGFTAEAAAVKPAPVQAGIAQAWLAPELDNALREPQSACAVVYSLLLGRDSGRDAQIALLKDELPKQVSFVLFLADLTDRLPRSARLPLLDLAMPALRQLAQQERAALLRMTDRMIAADHRMTLAEFVLQTILTRRLDLHAGRAVPVRFFHLATLREDCMLLLSLVAHVAASNESKETPRRRFMRGTAQLGLGSGQDELRDAAAIRFEQVKTALDRANELAPLVKPALIKALLATAGDDEMQPVTADLLRAVCAAIDAPVPLPVAATYTAYHWQL